MARYIAAFAFGDSFEFEINEEQPGAIIRVWHEFGDEPVPFQSVDVQMLSPHAVAKMIAEYFGWNTMRPDGTIDPNGTLGEFTVTVRH